MNIKKETESKLNFYKNRIEELKSCLKYNFLTKDATDYISDEIIRSNKNVRYYNQILNLLGSGEWWPIGVPVLILGESGSGKSTSMRNFEKEEIGIFNVASKPLPFRKKLNKIDRADYKTIIKCLSKPTLKSYVIDDSQYLMAFEMFDRAKETGYNKFTDVALNFRNLIQFIITETPNDVIVYFLHHCEQTETGKIKAKTSGKC